MSATVTREELYQQIIIDQLTGQETVDELRELCVAAGMFEGDPGLKRARVAYMDRVIRNLARQDGWLDKDGLPFEQVNIPRSDPESGSKTHFYLDLKLLTFEDQFWLVKDRQKKGAYFISESRRYFDDGVRKFGRKFQNLFQFE